MTRRAVVVPLLPLDWCPPGIDAQHWRAALAEDLADLINGLAEAEPALAVAEADAPLAAAVRWPTTRVYEQPRLDLAELCTALHADGYAQVAMIAPDAPDLPAMLIGKLLRPLSSRPVAIAPAQGGGLSGFAVRLPVPPWLAWPLLDFAKPDVDMSGLRARAPRPGDVATAPGWHRLNGADGLARLDPAIEGWEATRALLYAGSHPGPA